MKNCIFCQIVEGALEASIAYEDEHCMVLMDLFPLGNGHTLVIPRHHARQLPELSSEVADHLARVSREVLVAQRTLGWGIDGSHLLLNDGPWANQQVPHLHWHIIPRQKRDALKSLSKLALHVTGIFGFPAKRKVLDEQARQLRETLPEVIPFKP